MSLSRRSAFHLLLLIWVLSSVICVVPPLVIPNSINFNYCQYNDSLWFTVQSAGLAFYLPLLLLILCYAAIFCQLWKKMKRKEKKLERDLEMATWRITEMVSKSINISVRRDLAPFLPTLLDA